MGVHAIVIVYAVDDQASLHCLQGLFESMLLCGVVPPPRGATAGSYGATSSNATYAGASNDVAMVLVGAKADGPVSSREVEASDAAALANLWGIPHCEVSAQTPQFASLGGSHRYMSAAGGGDKGGGRAGSAGGGGGGSGLAAGGGEGGGPAGGGASQTAARPYGAPTPSGHGHDSQLGLAGMAVTSGHFHSSTPLGSGAPPMMAGMGMGLAAPHQSSGMYTHVHGGQPFAPMAASVFLQLSPAHQQQYLAQLQQYQQQQQHQQQHLSQQQMGAGAYSPFPHGGQHNAYPFSPSGGDAYAGFGQQSTHGHGHGQRAVVTTADGLQVLVPITAATPTAGAGGPFSPQHYGHGYNPQQQHYPHPHHGHAAGGHFGGANPLSSPFGTNSGQYGHGLSGHYSDGDTSAQAVGVGGLAAGSEAELALIRQMQAAGVDIAAAVAASGGGAGGANAHLFFGGGTVAAAAAVCAGGGGADDGSGRLCLTGLFFSSSVTADAAALEGPSGGGATVDTVFAYLAEEIGRKDGM